MKNLVYAALLIVLSSVLIQCSKNNDDSKQAPKVMITYPTDGQEIQRGQTVTISVDATDKDGSIAEVSFYINQAWKSDIVNMPFNYTWQTKDEYPDNYSIKAIVEDNDGLKSSDEVNVIIVSGNGNAPIAEFSASPTSGNLPLTVNFVSQSINNPTMWNWDFGDGNTSTEANPTHIYQNEGNFDVTLTVSNSYGNDTKTKASFISVNSGGSGCGGQTNIEYGGQTYEIVEIGNQCWMAENLNYYTGNAFWYNGNSTNGEIYGSLYTWETALTVCPDGWHLPSDNDWKTIEMYLGMSQSEADDTGYRGADEGKKMKSSSRWDFNGNGTNSSGFNALPGGVFFNTGGQYYNLGGFGTWWTSNEESSSTVWIRELGAFQEKVFRSPKSKGFACSVRCVKD